MLGPTTLGLMLLPTLLGLGLCFALPPRMVPRDWRFVRGVWLIVIALPLAVTFDHLRGQASHPALVNRTEAVLLSAIAAALLMLNRRSLPATRWGAGLIASGVWLNALGVVVYGYMPVLQSAAEVAQKPFTAHNPSPAYVKSEDLSLFGVVVGDFIPIPDARAVLSIGDLLLFAGCVVLLGLFFAWLFRPGADAGELANSATRPSRDVLPGPVPEPHSHTGTEHTGGR